MRKTLLVATASLGLLGGLALPATAATTGDTTTTFSLTAGGLALTAPTSAALGAGAIGADVSASLGSVSVSDARGALLAAWTATAVATDFKTGTNTAAETVGAALVDYWSGASTASTGTAVAAPGQLLAANAVAINAAKTAFSLTAGVGNNSTTWAPTLVVNVPSTAVAGAYSGTITHSVA
jgi:type IV secretory pathway TrbL component